MSLKEFYSQIQSTGIFYSHNFEVEFLNNSMAKHYASSTSTPSKSISTRKIHKFGIEGRYPGIVSFPDSWSISVICDEDLTLHDKYSSWSDNYSSYDNPGGLTGKFPEEIAYISFYDGRGKISKTMSIFGIYPTNVGEIVLSHTDSSGIATFNVVLGFQYWKWGF